MIRQNASRAKADSCIVALLILVVALLILNLFSPRQAIGRAAAPSQYKIITTSNHPGETEKVLNALAQEGWELVSFSVTKLGGGEHHLVLKK